jgi:hypothetical protein
MERAKLTLESSDRRVHDRVEAELSVRFKIMNRRLAMELLEPGLPEVTGESVNVSMGGLCLAVPSPLNRGDYLKVEMTFPSGPGPVRALAEVMWCRRQDQEYHCGIRFLMLFSEMDGKTIENFMRNIGKKFE